MEKIFYGREFIEMIKSSIPRGGNIPPSIRKKNQSGKIGLNINIGGFGLGNVGGSLKPQKKAEDFKPMGKYPGKNESEQKISLEMIKNWIVLELAHLFELKEGNKRININTKKRWLLGFLPDSMIQEIINKAKKLSKEIK